MRILFVLLLIKNHHSCLVSDVCPMDKGLYGKWCLTIIIFSEHNVMVLDLRSQGGGFDSHWRPLCLGSWERRLFARSFLHTQEYKLVFGWAMPAYVIDKSWATVGWQAQNGYWTVTSNVYLYIITKLVKSNWQRII